MDLLTANKASSAAGMARIFLRVQQRVKELGLSFSSWDEQGQEQGAFSASCEYCELVHGSKGPCLQRAGEIVRQSLDSGEAKHGMTPCGCAVMAVPAYRRRRLVGAAAACYPTQQLLDQEFLARACSQFELDYEVTAAAAARCCKRGAAEAGDLLRLLQWALESEQALQTANSELETLSTNLTSTYEELSLLYQISGAMKVTRTPQDFLLGVCRDLQEVMNISAAAAVMYAHPPLAPKDVVVVSGEVGLTSEQLKELTTTQIKPLLAKTHRPILENQFVWRTRPDLAKAVRNLIAVPMAGEGLLGVLLVVNKMGDFNSVDLKLMSSIGSQSAVFLSNSMLYADLQDLLMGVLRALTATIDAKDPYTCGHSYRVAELSRRLAQEHNLPPERVQRVHLAGLLHDIGKIGVAESTLCKPGRLTDAEYEDIKKHPGLGARILGGIRQLDDVVGWILAHHERLDGRGYPQGLSGKDLPMEARIIGLADSFDAMTSDRTYRKALPLAAASEEIRKHAGTQFDPELVRTFLRIDLPAVLEELRQPEQAVPAAREDQA